MAQMCFYALLVALFCGIYAYPPYSYDDYYEDDNSIDGNGDGQKIDLSYLGKRIFGAPSAKTGSLVASWTPEQNVNPEELGEYAEGDILHPTSEAIGRNGMVAETLRWKNGVVPYVISGSYSANERDNIKKAIADYHRLTCIRFVERTNEQDYLIIGNGKTGCWSSVGKIGGRQEVNLQSPGCVTLKGTVIHELMHALGFLHEQSRPERDDFVRILFQNIKTGDAYNFEKAKSGSVTGFGVTYDYDSVMHYGAYAFSTNQQPTIVPKKTGAKIGQRDGLSQGDITKINAMYKCNKPAGSSGNPIVDIGTGILQAIGSIFGKK